MDRHSWRDIWYAIAAAFERRKQSNREQWERTGLIIDAIINFGSNRPAEAMVEMGHTYRALFESDAVIDERITNTLDRLSL